MGFIAIWQPPTHHILRGQLGAPALLLVVLGLIGIVIFAIATSVEATHD